MRRLYPCGLGVQVWLLTTRIVWTTFYSGPVPALFLSQRGGGQYGPPAPSSPKLVSLRVGVQTGGRILIIQKLNLKIHT